MKHRGFPPLFCAVSLLLLPTANALPLHGLEGGQSSNGFVSSTHDLATDAGLEILRMGGNAADAAAAVQFALSVVQPQSTGIGGGCFVLMMKDNGDLIALDGREEAPAAFHPNIFCQDEDCFPGPVCNCSEGAITPHAARVVGGLSNGVPGVIAAMERLVRDHGKLSLAEVLEPSIRLAEHGFVMYRGMFDSIVSNLAKLATFDATAELFLSPDRSSPRVPVGEMFINLDIADTLRRVADGGAEVFYQSGPIPDDIVAATRGAVSPTHGRFGVMNASDLLGYQAVYRTPLVTSYRDVSLVGFPPPSSGGVALAQMFNWMEGYNVSDLAKPEEGGEGDRWSGELVARFVDAQNGAFADRDMYVADADFSEVPVAGLVDKAYMLFRRGLLSLPDAVSPVPLPHGVPADAEEGRYAASPPSFENGTTHASIVDRHGFVVSLTTTIEAVWGSGVVVGGRGFLLNNEMTDFSTTGNDPVSGLPYANRPEGGKKPRRTALAGDEASLGGKRPRSSMTPTIVLDAHGRPIMAAGAPGGSTIIAGTANVILQSVDMGVRGGHFPEADAEVQFVTDHSRIMSRNTDLVTAENDVPADVLEEAQGWGCDFEFSNGIALVQSAILVYGGDRLLFAGACDSKRQYQGEGVCKAVGVCAGGSLSACNALCRAEGGEDASACLDLCGSSCDRTNSDDGLPLWLLVVFMVGLGVVFCICSLCNMWRFRELGEKEKEKLGLLESEKDFPRSDQHGNHDTDTYQNTDEQQEVAGTRPWRRTSFPS